MNGQGRAFIRNFAKFGKNHTYTGRGAAQIVSPPTTEDVKQRKRKRKQPDSPYISSNDIMQDIAALADDSTWGSLLKSDEPLGFDLSLAPLERLPTAFGDLEAANAAAAHASEHAGSAAISPAISSTIAAAAAAARGPQPSSRAQPSRSRATAPGVAPMSCDSAEAVPCRRERKNNREKRRRQAMNDRFQELVDLLTPPGGAPQQPVRPKWNKADVLGQAISAINDLRVEVAELRAQSGMPALPVAASHHSGKATL